MGTILALLTNQVLKTAQAAKDVLFEKESFKGLSEHLSDIAPVLKELQHQKINDSQATRQALESLQSDVKKANHLVEKYKNRARFYLLIKCRYIVKEVQDVTRDIGRSLATLSLANTEVLSGISDQLNRLQNEMQRVEFEASKSQLQIVDKLNQGLTEQKLDQGFANDMLEEIAKAVGVPIEPSEISKELASFRREKEEAEDRKERAEVFFLEQVIELLSRADAAKDHEEIKRRYFQRVEAIERYSSCEEYISPFNPFICPINGNVMVDPVSLCTGTTCERTAIEAWFDCGKRTDPETGQLLEDFSFRSNLPLRKSIEEWRELNYCLKIRSAKMKLLVDEDSCALEALDQMEELLKENSINKDWISIGGVTDVVLTILGDSRNSDVKRKILINLKIVVEGHLRNKEKVIELQGLYHIIPCLGCDSSVSKAAVELLFELSQDDSGSKLSLWSKLCEESTAILFLVALLKGAERESAEKAEIIMLRLCDENEEFIAHVAKAGWYKPLIDRIVQGQDSSGISMAKALAKMELNNEEMRILGEEGILPPLLKMVSSNIESGDASLSALVKLINCHPNKVLLAAFGGIPLILNLMFSSQTHPILITKCSEILAILCSNNDGIEFLVDENRNFLDLDTIVINLLSFQKNPNSSHIIRRYTLRSLLYICKSESRVIKTAVLNGNAVSVVLPLLDESDEEIRETSVNLLFLFSQHEAQGVVEYLLMPRRLEVLVGFLENEDNKDAQMAAVGLLANLPKSEALLTSKLIESEGLNAIINVLKCGSMEAKENALSALFRFTDPSNVESQRIVVELHAYPLLVKFLEEGSETAKARAAALIGNLSMSSYKLSVGSKSAACWCIRRRRRRSCKAHGGICSVDSTFCLLEAHALPLLVKILEERVHSTSFEAIQTLSTLIQEENPPNGVNVLHEANAIKPILEILNWGTSCLKEEALGVLERVFASKEMVGQYGSIARLYLLGPMGRNMYENGERLGGKAAKVLSQVERSSRSRSSSFVQGLYG